MAAEYALALATGLVAAVNPCGFALLPAYLSFLVLDDGPGRGAAVGRALAATAAMTGGFVGVFGAFGLAVAPVAGSIGEHLPWVTVGVGVLLVVAGGWLLAGRQLPALVPRLGRIGTVRRSAGSMVLFGAAFAVASLGCTIGPFLAVVVSSFRTGETLRGIGLFVAYAAGMGLVVGVVALAVALARISVVNRIRRAAPVIARAGGLLLLLAGSYVAYYGWYSLRVFRGTTTHDPVVDRVSAIQEWAASWLGGAGAAVVAVVFAVLLIAAIGTAALHAVHRRRAP